MYAISKVIQISLTSQLTYPDIIAKFASTDTHFISLERINRTNI
jgi:hypothetical protein